MKKFTGVKKLTAALVLVLLLALPAWAATDSAVLVWAAQATSTSKAVDTTGYGEAQVTIWAVSGSPDGTVRIYYQPPNGAPLVLLSTYATPTTAKTFRGPAGITLVFALTGMSTGTVGAVAVLK